MFMAEQRVAEGSIISDTTIARRTNCQRGLGKFQYTLLTCVSFRTNLLQTKGNAFSPIRTIGGKRSPCKYETADKHQKVVERVIYLPQCKGLQRIPPGRSMCSCRHSCDTTSLLRRLLTRDIRRCLQELVNASSCIRSEVINDSERWMGGHLVCQACKLMGNVNAGNLRQGWSPR